MALNTFVLNVWDYLIISGLFVFSSTVGLYYAFRDRKQQTSRGYFLGNRNMSIIPVSLSIVVSTLSAITYIGVPSEVYSHGPMFWLMSLSYIIGANMIATGFVPAFYNLDVTSVYEYLDIRFNKHVRYMVIFVECSNIFIYMGIVIYAPALALSTMTGLSPTGSILALGLVCTFYTTIGGIKAVIWTDVLHATLMFSGLLIISVTVCLDMEGGIAEVWRRSKEGQRSQLTEFNLDPTLRYSFWTVIVGGTINILSFAGAKQNLVQRYNSCKSEFQAKMAAFIGFLFVGVVTLAATFTGVTMYAYYAGCDPITTKRVSRPDQLIPLLIVDLFHTVPGLPGLLIVGAFSGSLSSVSSLVNALAAITGQDIVKTIWKDISEERYTLVVKILSAVYGLSAIGVAFIAATLGDVIQAILSFGAIFGAPVLGVFSLGLFCPRANSKGAFVGLLLGVAVGITLKVGSGYFPQSYSAPPLSESECDVITMPTSALAYSWSNTSHTTAINDGISPTLSIEKQRHPVTEIFSVSYLHYNTIDWLVTMVVGLIVSYLSGATDPATLDPKLLSPVVLSVFSCCWPKTGGSKMNDRNQDQHEYNMSVTDNSGGDKNVDIAYIQ